MRYRLVVFLACCLMACLAVTTSPQAAFAHPEDELCVPGGGMDPALCRELQELDRAGDGTDSTGATDDVPGGEVELDRSWLETATFYVRIGFEHILPMGVDHILFVLALFLSSRRVKPLLWQVSAFTLAHTSTLGLAAAGVIAPPASIVEPLIALTIAWAALENILFKEPSAWRPALVFGFGLIHGMGFAGAFGDLGLPPVIFWPALIGFNVGVELGQLAVIGMALAVAVAIRGALKQAGRPDLYRPVLVWPVSAAIGAIGLWWAIERAFLNT
jgi:HupE / UreJ protein